MNSKIGKRELEIIEYLQGKREEAYAQLLSDFSPTNRTVPGKEYLQYNVVERRLQRLRRKGLISIEKRGLHRFVRLAGTVCDEHIGLDD